MKKAYLIGAAIAALVVTPAFAAESLVVPFTSVSNGTTQQYSGTVHVTVSGVGNSNGRILLNDAFYYTPSGTLDPDVGYYQLGFSTTPLDIFDAKNAIVNTLGYRPVFNPSSFYSFDLNVGPTLSTLYFGVTDGQFLDNAGAYVITLGVPEPATWSLMIAGFGAVGFAMRRRQAPATA